MTTPNPDAHRPQMSEVLHVLDDPSVSLLGRPFAGLTSSLYSDSPAWKRLITCPLTTHERISLITTILSNRDEIEAVDHLYENDAQFLVDIIYEVPLHNPSSQDRPTDFDSNLRVPLIRCWTA